MPKRSSITMFMAISFVLFIEAAPVSGYRLTPDVQISQTWSPDRDRFLPAVAYNSSRREYLVAWHQVGSGSRQVYTRLVSHDGTPLEYPNRITAAEWRDNFQPAVAYNATTDQYLVVWMVDAQGDGSLYEIWGQLLHPNNEPVSSVFPIYTWANRRFWTPKVAWNSQENNFFVIWNATDLSNVPTDVAGVHVSAAGVPDTAAHIITTANHPHQANLAYHQIGGAYLLVWRREYSPSDWDIYGALVHSNGSLIGEEFPINQENTDSQSPAVASSGLYYLVVWQHWAGPVGRSVWDIAGQVMTFAGGSFLGPFPIAASDYDAMAPAVVGTLTSDNASDFLTVFQQEGPQGTSLRARRDRLVENVLKPALDQFEVSPGLYFKNTNPAVAASPDGYFMAYEGDSTSDPTVYQHIYGRAWVLNSIYLPLIKR
jgi:hypothetical protein